MFTKGACYGKDNAALDLERMSETIRGLRVDLWKLTFGENEENRRAL